MSDEAIVVHLEEEPFYRDALGAISDRGSVKIEHVRAQGHALNDGIALTMQRHFILAMTIVPRRVVE